MTNIEEVVGEISVQLRVKHEARDRALVDSRQIVRYAANAIRAMHRGDYDLANRNLGEGRAMVTATKRDLADHPDIYWAGYVQDAQKEFAEANFVAAIIQKLPVPEPIGLGVENAPYLNGLAEAASEMRRYILDVIRTGGWSEMDEAERVLTIMDDVYTTLITVDFPDAITGGLRRTTDAFRAVLERTRGDLTISMRQAELARALEGHASSSL